MNFKSQILLVAFVSSVFLQFATGLAHAYYNPQTGRWLSRDPVGEPGFQLVQRAIGTLPSHTPATSLPPGSWLVREQVRSRADADPYGFVGNDPLARWDSLGLLTATGGSANTSLRRHNNYLSFKITCPKCTKFANWSVDYSGTLTALVRVWEMAEIYFNVIVLGF